MDINFKVKVTIWGDSPRVENVVRTCDLNRPCEGCPFQSLCDSLFSELSSHIEEKPVIDDSKILSWDELIEGKIYLTHSYWVRVVKVLDDYMYVLPTENFVKLSDKDKEIMGFIEYPYGFPKMELLKEELVSGKQAIMRQISDGRAEKEVVLKRPEAILRKLKPKLKTFLKNNIGVKNGR